MDSDLEKLRSITAEPQIRSLVETLVVQDESNTLDPFAVPDLPSPDSTYRIWPRHDSGIVIASEIGTSDLRHMFREKLLCPRTIIVRSYQINPVNMFLCEEYADFRHLVRKTPQNTAEPRPLAVLVRDIVDGANLDIVSLAFENVDYGHGFNSVLGSTQYKEKYPDRRSAVSSPGVREAIIQVDPTYSAGLTRVSMLRSVDMQLGREAEMYWLQKIFYEAPELKTLKLSLKSLHNRQLEAEKVVPELTEFFLNWTRISGDDLLAMIASSKESLKHITLLQVVLDRGSTWLEVLTGIAKGWRALQSFTLRILRESNNGDPAVDFREVKDDHIPEQCRAGLDLTPIGREGNKRVTRLSYSGVDAGRVLEIIAASGYVPESLESGKRPM
jgi:hypothetical protein